MKKLQVDSLDAGRRVTPRCLWCTGYLGRGRSANALSECGPLVSVGSTEVSRPEKRLPLKIRARNSCRATPGSADRGTNLRAKS